MYRVITAYFLYVSITNYTTFIIFFFTLNFIFCTGVLLICFPVLKLYIRDTMYIVNYLFCQTLELSNFVINVCLLSC